LGGGGALLAICKMQIEQMNTPPSGFNECLHTRIAQVASASRNVVSHGFHAQARAVTKDHHHNMQLLA
jgi:hypothetical protein